MAHLGAVIHQPATEQYPGTAIVEVTGFRSTPHNTTERLAILADHVGAPVVGLFRPGAETTRIDLGLRRELHPTRYRQTVAERFDEIREGIADVVGEFAQLVGHGPSGGGVYASALALEGLFERLQLTDGINYRAIDRAEPTIPGIYNFLKYLQRGEQDRPLYPDDPVVPPSESTDSWFTTQLRGFFEIAHYSPLMLSTASAGLARQLADAARLPLHVVSIGHTFTGDETTAVNFGNELVQRRAATVYNRDPATPAELKPTFEPGMYHSDLTTRPDLIAKLLHQTLALEPARS